MLPETIRYIIQHYYCIIIVLVLLLILFVWKYSTTYELCIENPSNSSVEYLSSTPSTIKILSYNIQGLPHLNKTNFIPTFHKLFKQYDIILIQEAFQNFWSLRTKLRKQFPNYWITHSGINSLFNLYLVDSGLMIISKYPIKKSKFVPWIIDTFPDSLAQKGILYSVIQITKDIDISLYTLHTQASFNTINENKDIRDVQFLQLLQLLKKDKTPIKIVGGDFNFDYSNQINPITYKIMKGSPTICSTYDSNGNETYSFPYSLLSHRDDPCEILDYFIVPINLNCQFKTIFGYSLESDHNPIELIVNL